MPPVAASATTCSSRPATNGGRPGAVARTGRRPSARNVRSSAHVWPGRWPQRRRTECGEAERRPSVCVSGRPAAQALDRRRVRCPTERRSSADGVVLPHMARRVQLRDENSVLRRSRHPAAIVTTKGSHPAGKVRDRGAGHATVSVQMGRRPRRLAPRMVNGPMSRVRGPHGRFRSRCWRSRSGRQA